MTERPKQASLLPVPRAQMEVIVEALAVAGVTPRSVGYVEAHGTATQLGDAVELDALTRAFREQTDDIGFCALGSVKTNVGHLDTAAGIAGLIKAVLAVEHGKVPPSLHFTAPNPKLALPTSPFFVATSLQPFPGVGPRRAGVSSFGIGGTNAHLILEEPPQARPQPAEAPGAQLLVLSARSGNALAASARQPCGTYARNIPISRSRTSPLLCNAADSALVIAGSLSAATKRRRSRRWKMRGRRAGSMWKPRGPVAFMLTGQSECLAGAGAGLYRDEKVFRDQIDQCSDTAEKLLGVSLRTLLCTADETAAAMLSRTEFASLHSLRWSSRWRSSGNHGASGQWP